MFTISEWINLASVFVLLLTALIIWWYTNETKKLRIEAQNQVKISQEQTKVSQEQTEVFSKQLKVSQTQIETSNKQFELSKFGMVKTFRNGFIDVEIFPDDNEILFINNENKAISNFCFLDSSGFNFLYPENATNFDDALFMHEFSRSPTIKIKYQLKKSEISRLKNDYNIPLSFSYNYTQSVSTQSGISRYLPKRLSFHVQHFIYNPLKGTLEETLFDKLPI